MLTTTTLILDGIWGKPARFAKLRRALEETCGPNDVFPYDTSGTGCLAGEGRRLAAHIRQLDRPVNVVAFSMGGLVVRAAHESDPALPIRRAAFLNSPHGGSLWCHLAAPFRALRGIRQMRPASAFLRRLSRVEWRIPTLAVWCPFDPVVFPGTSARWKAATHRVCSLVPVHEWPIISAAIHARVAEFLRSDDRSDSAVARATSPCLSCGY